MQLATFLLRPPSVAVALHRFREAERLGYAAAFATNVNSHEALSLMAAAAVQTDRIRIGVGVVPIYTRPPATMAQAAATLWEMSGGRSLIGLGLGHRVVMERWYGEQIEHPVEEMRDYVSIVRAIVGGAVPPPGRRWRSDLPLVLLGPFDDMPILIGALSPAMLRLAGEIADGVVLWLATPAYIADTVVPQVSIGRARVGKTVEGFEIVASIPCAVTDDALTLRRSLTKQIAHNLRLPFYRSMLERGGHGDDLKLVDEVAAYEELDLPIDPNALTHLAQGSIIESLAAIGSPEVVAAKLAEFGDAGVTLAGVNPVRIADFDACLAAVRRAVPG
jgi:alkanesulfonate monooxygenase SsuD/methylene tetrahydromethanopterin reductase-like flavin-dependent oxidoreductase (luciferase family)